MIRPGRRVLFLGKGIKAVAPRGSAGESWWLSGEVDPANAISVYQPLGAASYAASLVNLANPGTYDLTSYGGDAAPLWSDVGWYPNGVDNGRLSGGLSVYHDWTVLIRVDLSLHKTQSYQYLTIADNASMQHHIAPNWIISGSYYLVNWRLGGNAYVGIGNVTDTVLGLAGIDIYRDGIDIGDQASWKDRGAMTDFRIQMYTNKFRVKAVAIYNSTLTPAQVAAVSAAMAAL